MKRKEITETIAKVGAGTFALNGSMSLINPKTGEGFDVDMGATARNRSRHPRMG